MNTQKQGFAPIIIILVVVVIGITYLMRTQKNTIPVSTQTTDKTANWKTYVNVDNTFNFKYPDRWIIQPKQVYGSRSVTEFRFQNNPLFIVTQFGNYNQITGQPFKTLEEYLGVRKNAKSKGFMLDGIQAKRVTDPGETGHILPYEEVVAFSKDNKFIISIYFEPDYYPQAVKDKTLDQILSTFKFTTPTTDTTNWTVYTNKTFGYSLKFPTIYQVPPQTEKQKSQLGVDNNICVKKNTAGIECVVLIDSFKNSDNLSLEDYLNKNLKMFGLFEATNPLASPLVSYKFNGYDALFNKNEYVFVKHGQYVYHINAPKASSDKEVRDIVATFKFTGVVMFKFTDDSKILNYDKAIKILQAIPEIQTIENAVIKNGRKTFFMQNDINGDVVNVSFTEDGFPDQHTTRIDTFNVNIQSKVITVVDVMSGGKDISLEDWKKTVKERFP